MPIVMPPKSLTTLKATVDALVPPKPKAQKKPPGKLKVKPKRTGGPVGVAGVTPHAGYEPYQYITYVSQSPGRNWCWASCAVMVADFLGLPTTDVKDVVRKQLGSLEDVPQSSAQIASLYQSGNVGGSPIGCSVKSGPASQDQLDTALAYPIPVQFGVTWNGGGGHVMLIVGREVGGGRTLYHINDPDPNTRERLVTYAGLVSGEWAWRETIWAFQVL